jgi:epoxyqueuosine reductase
VWESPSAIRYGCDASQTVCPWNVRFAHELPEGSPFRPRPALAGKDARTLAREVLAMDVDAYRAAFRGSAMKRAKLPMLRRNAAVVLGNVGTVEDVPVLERALDDPEPLVREHVGFPEPEDAPRILDGRRHLQPVAHDAGIA